MSVRTMPLHVKLAIAGQGLATVAMVVNILFGYTVEMFLLFAVVGLTFRNVIFGWELRQLKSTV